MSVRLAIDTATDVGCVALASADGSVREVRITDRRHAAEVLPAMQGLLDDAGAAWSDVEGIVVANGPGSFTGLRIGFATVRGVLAVHPHIALSTMPSLLGTAWATGAGEAGTVASLYDALRGEVFAAVYRFGGDVPETLVPPGLVSVGNLIGLPKPDCVGGDGAAVYREELRRWLGAEAPPAPQGASASALLALHAIPGVAEPIPDPDLWDPTYGRRAAAQDRWEAEHGRPLPDSPGD